LHFWDTRKFLFLFLQLTSAIARAIGSG